MEPLYSSQIDSPAGKLILVTSTQGLLRLEFARRANPQLCGDGRLARPTPAAAPALSEAEGSSSSTQGEIMDVCCRQLDEYFAGRRRDFTIPLDLRGTPFQLACWNALLAIPYGETRSYADIARAVGRPQGFRAVGLANNRNPIAIIVPCHRVIASDGSLCGYGGGLETKRKLLELEGALAVAQPALIA